MNLKKFIVVAITIIVVVVVVTFCFRSCQQEKNGLLDLLPSSEEVETVVNTPLIIEEIKQLGRLESVEINLQQVFESSRNQDTLWGAFGEKATYLAYCQIIAGVDLSLLTEEDILIDGENIEINLPSAEIFCIYLTENSFMVNREKGIFTSYDSQLEGQIRQKALKYFEGQAKDLGIIDTAQANAQMVVNDFLVKIGFKEISFKTDIEIDLS